MWSQVFITRIYLSLRQLIFSMVLELQKTKKTIVENEQLRKEVAYHTAQTEILLQQNEKLLQDLAAANRTLQLAKEVRKFHMILEFSLLSSLLIHKQIILTRLLVFAFTSLFSTWPRMFWIWKIQIYLKNLCISRAFLVQLFIYLFIF